MKYLRAKQRRRTQEQQFAEAQSASSKEIENDKGEEDAPSQTK
jgi:hypothetical protein